MYGPYFLLFYGSLIGFSTLILMLLKSRFDLSDKITVPSVPSNIDPFEIAYLRGGTNETIRSVVFSLVQKGFVEIIYLDAGYYVKKINSEQNKSVLSEIEQTVYDWIGGLRQIRELFDRQGLSLFIESYTENYQSRLTRQQLLTGENEKNLINPVKWSLFLMILLLGVYKLLAALAAGRTNVIFLILLTLIGLFLINYISRLPRITKLGKAYLEKLQIAFDNLKYTSQAGYLKNDMSRSVPAKSFAGIDPILLSVGVFGGGFLAGTVFDSYNQAFQKAQNSVYTGGSSCGSSGCGTCTSSSSCSGGSSCSSGSSCGGGCGGCGGGCS